MSTLRKSDTQVVENDNVEPQPPQGRGEHPTLNADTARQGPRGTRVFFVLALGLIGAAVLLAVVYAVFFTRVAP